MKIEILGCSGSVMQGYNTTSILIDGNTLIDAGSVSSVLAEDSVENIRDILITHTHIDHIKELPFILDSLYSGNAKGIRIWGSKQTIDTLTTHVFNGLIWPDMNELKIKEDFLTLHQVSASSFEIGGLKARAWPVDHIDGSVCYCLTDNGKHVLFSGDTGYDPQLFGLVKSLAQDLRALFVEVSFPNRLSRIAQLSRHLTPELVVKGLDGILSSSTKVIAYHIKPKYLDEVVSELPPGFEYIKGGEVFEL